MKKELNFEGLARLLLSQSRDILFRWLPGGKLVGAEYCCGSLNGESGDSLKVNINKGLWKDFATGEKGGDLVSLYAALKKQKQGDAFKELSAEFNFEQDGLSTAEPNIVKQNGQILASTNLPKIVAESDVIQPPIDTDISKPLELFKHRDHGKPSAVWFYRNTSKEVLFGVARYESPKGKQILPWTWDKRGFWNCKGWPAPRPLFGLELLIDRPDAPILLVEGEKDCSAARAICGHAYVVLTWPNGAQAINKTDWTPIYGRRILIWPDADKPGLEAARAIAKELVGRCPQVRILEVPCED